MAAVEVAKALNCLVANDGDACDECPSCRKINSAQHPDVHTIDNADEEIRLEDVRQLQKSISLRAYEGKKKCFIIRHAQRLNPESANALLKTLEEPVGGSCIMLITAKPALLFKTILSRCQSVRFTVFTRARLEELLKMEYGVEVPLAHFLAYFCEGRLGAALRLKDTHIIEEKNAVIDELFIKGRERTRYASALEKADLRRNLAILTTWFRDMYLIKLGSPYRELINLDRKEDLLRFMNHFSFTELEEVFRLIAELSLYLERNINPRLLLAHLRLAFMH